MKSFLFLLVFLLWGGCRQFMPGAGLEEEFEVDTEPVVEGPLLARVGSWAISLNDFQARLDTIRAMYPDAVQFDHPDSKKGVLQELVNMQMLAEAAKGRGLHRERDVIREVNDYKRQILAERMAAEIAEDVFVSDTEVRNFYDSHRMSFRQPEERKIRKIVVNTESQARNVLVRLLQDEDFADVARQVSVADSAEEGGNLGYMFPDPEKKFERFWEEAYKLEEGQNSNYFRSPDGSYYIVKVEDIKGGEVMELSEIRSEIREHLRNQKVSEKLEEVLSEVRRRERVVINQDLLD